MSLVTFWFALIAVLWIGYFFLEGFDFGVGVLLPFLGRDEVDRRVMVHRHERDSRPGHRVLPEARMEEELTGVGLVPAWPLDAT